MKNNFKPIKVNFRDENKRPTSTSLNFNICYFFCECIAKLNGEIKNKPDRKTIEKMTQKMVNNYAEKLSMLSKDIIEQELLKDINMMILEYEKTLKERLKQSRQIKKNP